VSAGGYSAPRAQGGCAGDSAGVDGTFVLFCTLHALLRVRDDGEHIEHKLVQILDFFGVDAGRALRKQGWVGIA